MRNLASVAGAGGLILVAAALALAAVIDVHAGNYYFEDASIGDGQISARVGDQLRVTIDDAGGGTPHTVEVDALGIHSGPLLVGSTYATPILAQPGTFELYCRNHLRRGHTTTLVVTGAAITPAPTPLPTTLPTPRVTGTGPTASTLSPTASPAGSEGETTPSGPEASGAATGPGTPDQSPGPGLPPGVVGPSSPTWHRSVWVGLLAALPIGGAALAAGWLARRRSAR